jgi:signal peptidase I
MHKIMEAENKNQEPFWKELAKLVLLALVIVIPFRLYIAQPFIVDGASMDPTFKSGEYLIVDELTYRFKSPERGSILIFKYPRNPSKFFVKRVIGLPEETVIIEGGRIKIINAESPDGFYLEEPYVLYDKHENLARTLSEAEYFVMGDNRLGSADSRIWGPVPAKNIVGRPIIRFYPPTILPGTEGSIDFLSKLNVFKKNE